MGLSDNDKLEYKKGIYEVYQTLGASSILYYPFDSNSTRSIYAERKGATYLSPITLVGGIEHGISDSNPFKDVGKNDFNMTITIPILSLEKANLKPDDLLTGLFEFDGKKYNILSCNPKGLFADFFSTYEYQCKGVDSL